MALRALWLTALCAIAAQAWAAPRQTPLIDLFIETWTTRDGLPHNLVLDLAQTPDGYLWLATWEGIARFNGHEFVVIDRSSLAELSDNGIRALHVGASGSLWIATARGGVVRLLDGQWSFINRENGLENDQIMAVLEADAGALWILTEDAGVDLREADGSIRRYSAADGLPSNVAYAMVDAGDGRLLVATGDGLGVVEGSQARALGNESGMPRGPVLSLRRGADGRFFAGTERGVYVAAQDLQFRLVHPGLAGEAAQSLHVDADGTLWVGTIGSGLFRLAGDRLEHLGVEQGLPNGRVAAILRDREDSLWVSTNAGLVRLREAPFKSYGRQAGLADEYVRAVIEDHQGASWIGTSDGLTRVRGGRFETLGAASGLPGRSILSLGLGRGGALWVGTYYNGLAKLVGDRVVAVYDEERGLPSNSVRAVIESEDGTVWVGTSRGLARIDATGVRAFGLAEGLPRELVIAMHQDAQGSIWVGTTKGMARVEDNRLIAYDLSPYGGAHRVFGFAEEPDGTLWLATDRGLLRFLDGRFSHLGTAQGLPYDSLFAVVDDGVGGLWMSSNRGVLRVDREQAHAVADGRRESLDIERFGEGDGMASPQANGGSWPSAVRRSDGSVWFSTAKGVAEVMPEERQTSETDPPRVVIERVRVDDVEYPVRGAITLPAGARRVELAFAGLSFLQSHRIRYRYRLQGFDPDWVDGGTVRTAQFTNLPPGEFVFRVAAAHPNNGFGAGEASLVLFMPPRLWQREGFVPVSLLLGLMTIYGLYRWRIRQLRSDAHRLAALVDQRTADLRRHAERLQVADDDKSVLLGELQRQSEAFSRQAREDDLTGLGNRRAFDESLAREFARAQRSGEPLCLALLDVDHFKRVNDSYSHAAGDALLKALAGLMRSHSRDMDLVARWGGEEFALLFPNTPLPAAIQACERLRSAVESFDAGEIAPGLRITVSIGVAAHIGMSHHERMLIRADERLYEAKQAGRNRVCS